jgi:hypothetical protein
MATLLKVLNNLADIKSAGVLHFASELRAAIVCGKSEVPLRCYKFPLAKLRDDLLARQATSRK